ncbi:uncharacterized protein LOC126896800 [Daktulosphaira vitifoliae]|uniref:uncharacterized protein LOC126896800 n=1 Tax=Daktulosphaira vitifoliae TaxID=58002 RepID=UPI0021A99188|nr:uncharacterized protein LOC126896800 [Daktulosphaira vitifoliae]
MVFFLERIKHVSTLCHIFGAGFRCYDSKKAFLLYWTLYIGIVFFNILAYYRGIIRISVVFVNRLDIMSIINVICIHIRILTPLVMVCSKLLADNEVLISTIRSIDDLIPTLQNTSLFSYAWYFYCWIILHVITEVSQLFFFWSAVNFKYINCVDAILGTILNVVICIPIVQYNMIMLLIGRGIREINNDITSIRKWKPYRAKWKELKNKAQHITHYVYNMSIVIFVIYTMSDIFCFGYTFTVLVDYNKKKLIICFFITFFMRLGFCVELFRVANICKYEILRTQSILNDVKMNSILDLKEVQYTSLYMLHSDFNLMPCGCFNLSFRTLLTILGMAIACLAYQIQIKIG